MCRIGFVSSLPWVHPMYPILLHPSGKLLPNQPTRPSLRPLQEFWSENPLDRTGHQSAFVFSSHLSKLKKGPHKESNLKPLEQQFIQPLISVWRLKISFAVSCCFGPAAQHAWLSWRGVIKNRPSQLFRWEAEHYSLPFLKLNSSWFYQIDPNRIFSQPLRPLCWCNCPASEMFHLAMQCNRSRWGTMGHMRCPGTKPTNSLAEADIHQWMIRTILGLVLVQFGGFSMKQRPAMRLPEAFWSTLVANYMFLCLLSIVL